MKKLINFQFKNKFTLMILFLIHFLKIDLIFNPFHNNVISLKKEEGTRLMPRKYLLNNRSYAELGPDCRAVLGRSLIVMQFAVMLHSKL